MFKSKTVAIPFNLVGEAMVMESGLGRGCVRIPTSGRDRSGGNQCRTSKKGQEESETGV